MIFFFLSFFMIKIFKERQENFQTFNFSYSTFLVKQFHRGKSKKRSRRRKKTNSQREKKSKFCQRQASICVRRCSEKLFFIYFSLSFEIFFLLNCEIYFINNFYSGSKSLFYHSQLQKF